MANEYDKILRENFKSPKTNLLRHLIPAEIISIQPLIPKLQHTILEKETDTIAEILTEEGKSFIIHIEWQSSNDSKMASRMAMYDLMLYQTYQQEIMGVVLYVGNEKLRMQKSLNFFDFHYRCRMLDVRLLDPETFLSSNDPGEIIFAILAGKGGEEQKVEIVQRIFSKLQLLFANDTTLLRTKIKQLELLSLLRGKNIQKLIIKEEQKMPVTIDIREDLRYQQGVEEGKIETAKAMFEDGFDILTIQRITRLEIADLLELQQMPSKK